MRCIDEQGILLSAWLETITWRVLAHRRSQDLSMAMRTCHQGLIILKLKQWKQSKLALLTWLRAMHSLLGAYPIGLCILDVVVLPIQHVLVLPCWYLMADVALVAAGGGHVIILVLDQNMALAALEIIELLVGVQQVGFLLGGAIIILIDKFAKFPCIVFV